ncbi:betaine-aldehyde dehydrogenase [Amycolatopsis sp. WAC 04169]|uniref:aldehyde dehydrogenase family protein n=1 Tax=Amycolatopsis TaxID=1813 RepID=UPI000879D75A|nr:MULTISPECIES: aldehyde dehydrogenase family protein [Amycolatopsis]OLZ49702.1 betaine-aldehyde dehydrogenase [Amycolatopsis keratiniphila subsp. nogabecina]RSN28881.1 betaine-aldehyde dehydrogenase [Amycolatopsis sp. WAC 04169]SDU23059.1 aldehyde dehydrogenase (acceptor) [Amycolatopsis keratiniphila]
MATRLFIDGQWTAAGGGSLPTYDPATGHVIEEVGTASAADVDAAVGAARKALNDPAWAGLLPVQRAALLFKLASLVDEHHEELAALETRDQGQPIGISRQVSVTGAAEHLRYFAGWVTKIQGTTNPVSFPDTLHYTRREPVGVNALITPWNFPLMILVWKLAPALATGNTVVIKPSEVTPLTSIRLVELVHEAGFPPGVVNLVTGDGAVGALLSRHDDVDHLSYTGSTAVGKLITAASAESNLKRLTLELGGKAPSIISGDADIDAAVAGNLAGATLNSGQVCAAYTRFFVDRKREQEFVAKLAAGLEGLKLGPGLDESTQLGPLVSAKHREHVDFLVSTGSEQGAELVTGGKPVDRDGYFYTPTLFAGVADDMTIMREEIFGPVLAVTAYDDPDELLARANDTEYGLAATVWTRDLGVAQRFANGIRAGAVFVNMPPIPDMAAPWGGYKASGWGREMGPWAIDAYTEIKSVWLHYS